jgi:putative membrane protein
VTHHSSGALLLVAFGLAVGYEALTLHTGRWSRWRATSFLTGCALLVIALTPNQPGDVPTHVRQHLVVGMLAPTLLVLGAPVTLLLRALPATKARVVSHILRHRVVHVLAHPVTALLLSSGSLLALHMTPLYSAVTADPALHEVVLAHFLLSGWLFAWVLAGPDPAPRRPSVRFRLIVLGVAVFTHAALAQLLYAGVVGDPTIGDAQRRAGATLLYYGADAAEILLAFALVAARPPRRRRSNIEIVFP